VSNTQGPVVVPLVQRSFATELALPGGTTVLRGLQPERLPDPEAVVRKALASPFGAQGLAQIARGKLLSGPDASAVVVVSDNTRPVPYKGPEGILWPVVQTVLGAGFEPSRVLVLVAAGTHRVMTNDEIRTMVDERVVAAGVSLACHDSRDSDSLVLVRENPGGVDVFMNRAYVESDLKILTGLVEPHPFAGASGGRKSICPGLLAAASVRDFHAAKLLAHPLAEDLSLDGNPCHQISLDIGRLVEADFIINATVATDGRLAGVFAGGMEAAHDAAVEHLRSFSQIALDQEYDVVVTHAGYVGVNHYQAAKAAYSAARAAKRQGWIVLVADTIDPEPIGSESYRSLLKLLKEVGHEEFARMIQADHWEFAPDQWQAQMWAKIFFRVPPSHLFYFSPQTPAAGYAVLPVATLASEGNQREAGQVWADRAAAPGIRVTDFVRAAISEAAAVLGSPASVAYLADGPYSIPVFGHR
jgi:lactate racemase